MYTRTDFIPVQLEDGSSIRIQATVLGGEEDVAAIDKLIPFEAVTSSIEAISRAISITIQKVKPKKASVEFGIEVGVESGQLHALLVKGTTSGNLKITLEWGD